MATLAILSVGQSNARSTLYHIGGDLSVPANMATWNNRELKYGSKFVSAKIGEWPFNVRAINGVDWANNLSLSFCREASSSYDTKLVMIARGSHKIENFMTKETRTKNGWTIRSDTKDMSPYLLGKRYGAKRALRYLGKPVFDVVLFHQGEANGGNGIDIYVKKFITWHNNIFNAGLIRANTPIIVGGLFTGVPYYTNHKTAIQQVSAKRPQVKFVDSNGLTSNDSVHFDGPSITTLGQRYWAAFVG